MTEAALYSFSHYSNLLLFYYKSCFLKTKARSIRASSLVDTDSFFMFLLLLLHLFNLIKESCIERNELHIIKKLLIIPRSAHYIAMA